LHKASKAPAKEEHTSPVMEINEVFENTSPVKIKPLAPHRRMRHDYEKVWTCSSGDKKVCYVEITFSSLLHN